MYFSILANICWMRFAPKHIAFGGWALFIALAIASKMGWF